MKLIGQVNGETWTFDTTGDIRKGNQYLKETRGKESVDQLVRR